jgi:cyanate lyase
VGKFDSLFSDLILEEKSPDSNLIESGPIKVDIEALVNESMQEKPVKKSKSNKKKSNISKGKHTMKDISKPVDTVKLSAISYLMLDNAELSEFEVPGVKLKTPKSWKDFFVTMVGSVYVYRGMDRGNFESTMTSKNIFNENIEISRTLRYMLDRECENTEIFQVTGTDYYVSFIGGAELNNSILSGIRHMLEILQIPEKEVKLHLYKETVSYDNLTDPLIYSLYELVNKGIPSYISVISCGIGDDMIPVKSLKQAVEMMLIFLTSVDDDMDSVYRSLEMSTMKDVVGVSKNRDAYTGIMEMTQICDGYYFYTNGLQSKLIEYLYNVCNNLGIDTKDIKIKLGILKI